MENCWPMVGRVLVNCDVARALEQYQHFCIVCPGALEHLHSELELNLRMDWFLVEARH